MDIKQNVRRVKCVKLFLSLYSASIFCTKLTSNEFYTNIPSELTSILYFELQE